ncbi:MAG TPA: hypothetical protein GX530_04455 [Corynebacteriales bacterium]|nr:hypothetical protein [Mycobacteriales bacterium]
MAKKLKKLVSDLSYIGRRRVLRGDLADIGLKGYVFAPTGRVKAPVVFLLHDWLSPASFYKEWARHLASWGIACVVPSLDRALLTDAAALADETEDVIERLLTCPLGKGAAPLDRNRVGVFGHGLGGSVAALLAKRRPSLNGIVAAYPTECVPDPVVKAAGCKVPALFVAPEKPALVNIDISRALGNTWGENAIVRCFPGATRVGLVSSSIFERLGLTEKDDPKVLKKQKATITGFFLAAVMGDKDYKAFTTEEEIKGSEVLLTAHDEFMRKHDD